MSANAIALIDSNTHPINVSLVSFWELTIKESLGKLEVPGQVAGLYADWIPSEAACLLTVNWDHIQRHKQLPPVHRDPFDRMLIAQALTHDLTIVTADPHIPQYPGVNVLW
jgi:PIN domain nuclease of toxin-antitoxin system